MASLMKIDFGRADGSKYRTGLIALFHLKWRLLNDAESSDKDSIALMLMMLMFYLGNS